MCMGSYGPWPRLPKNGVKCGDLTNDADFGNHPYRKPLVPSRVCIHPAANDCKANGVFVQSRAHSSGSLDFWKLMASVSLKIMSLKVVNLVYALALQELP